MARSEARCVALACAGYIILTAGLAWPLVADVGGSITPIGDSYSHVWAVTWVSRQLMLDPPHLYDANMLWPHASSLAFRDPMIAQGLTAVPLRLLGASPLLAHNLVLLSTFVLAALGTYLLAFDLTRSRPAAFLAGLVFAFSPFRFAAFAQLNVLSIQWLPFVVLCFRRSALLPTPRRILGLSAFSLLLALSSGYYAVLLALALGACTLAELPRLLRRRSLLPVAASLVLAAALSVLVVLPQIGLRGRARTGWGVGALQHWSARPASYLYPGQGRALPHLDWLRRNMAAQGALYPGTAALLLGLLGAGWRGERRRLALLLTGTGMLLSFGPTISIGSVAVPGPFEWLRRVPPFDMMRTPVRLGILAQLGFALLVAHGVVRLGRGRLARVLVVALVCLQLVESDTQTLRRGVRPAGELPPSAAWLAQAPRGPVLELPWDVKRPDRDAGLYLYWSTAHWQPLLNGVSTFQPRGNLGLAALASSFPKPRTVRLLRGEGIRYVVIHTSRLPRDRRRRVLEAAMPAGVGRVQLGSDLVFQISPDGETEGRPKARRSADRRAGLRGN